MEPLGWMKRVVSTIGVFAWALVLCGCPAADHKSPKTQRGEQSQKKTEAGKTAASGGSAVPDKTPAMKELPRPEKTGTETKPAMEEKPSPTEKPVAPPEPPAEPKPDAPPPAPAKEDTPAKEEPAAKPVPEPAKDEPPPAKPEPKEGAANEKPQPPADEPMPEQRIPDLGPPLVDDMKGLTKLDKDSPAWIDKGQKQVVLQGETCKAGYPLEFFATLPDRGYESVVVIYTRPSIVHAGLLAVGAKPGKPAQFDPEYSPPTGTEIAIEVRWKDKDGKVQHARAQEWIRSIKTKKPMDVNWVFAGSMFRVNSETGEKRYMGDGGDFIAVLNLPTATLDIPIPSKSDLESRSFESLLEKVPPEKTPVTLVLTPKLDKEGEKKVEEKPAK